MSSVYRFADLALDTGRYCVERDGRTVELPTLSYELLLALVRAAPDVLTHDDIAERVWHGRAVSPETITQRVKLLREALGEDGTQPRYIAAVRGRGYRLIPTVTDGAELGPRSRSHARRLLLAGPAGVLALFVLGSLLVSVDRERSPATDSVTSAASNALAVLPLRNLSGGPDDADFINGLHVALLTNLGRISALSVIERASVAAYGPEPVDRRVIAAELGVATTLEGAVQRYGQSIRVDVQLFDTATDALLWGDVFERELSADTLADIQSEIARAVADTLRAVLTPYDLERLAERPTRDRRAYELYISGLDYFGRTDDRAFVHVAEQQFQRAVERDPEFALAWAGLSRAHTVTYWYSIDRSQQRLDDALAAAREALRLNPDLPEGHLALAQYYFQGQRDYPAALEAFERAEQGMAGQSELHFRRSMMLRRMGRWSEALAGLERAARLDPRNLEVLVRLADTNLAVRDYERAQQYIDRALDIEPDNAMVFLWKAFTPVFRDGDVTMLRNAAADPPMPLGRWRRIFGWHAALYDRDYEAALEHLDAWEDEAFAQNSYYIPKDSYYGVTHYLAGHHDAAKRYYLQARDILDALLASNGDDSRVRVSLAEALGGLGEREQALSQARMAIESLPPDIDALTNAAVRFDGIRRVFAPLAAVDDAVRELDVFLAEPGGSWSIEGLLPDPRIDPIKQHPDFVALVERYRR